MNLFAKLFRGSRSIRQRLFWRLGVLSLGTLSIVNLIWLPSSIREIRQSQAELQRVAVRSVRDQIQLFLEERDRQLKSQAVLFSAPFAENNQEAVRLLGHRFLQRDPAFEEIGIVDREGRERLRLSRKLVITDRELRDLSATPFYQEGMRGELSWASVFTTETSEPWVTLAVPLRASETTTIGVVFGVLSLKSLWDLTGEFHLTYGGRAYVVEQTGRVIAAADSSLVLRQLSFADRPLIQRLTHTASSAAHSFIQDVYVNENNVSVAATGLLLPGPQWAVVVEQSQALLYSPVKQKLWLSLGISFIGLLVSFGVAGSLSSRLSGPIIRLREGVKLIGHGQLKHRVMVEGADEVGELAMHFNTMAESLEEQEAARKQAEERIQRQLQQSTALREINLAITSTLDLRAVLDVLLEKIDLSLPYAVATVRLLNRETGELESVACRNLDEEEWKAATRGIKGGLGRMLPEDHSPVIVLNAQTDPRSLASKFLRKHGLVSYLRVPLIGKGEVLGVLTFFTKEEHQFSEEEIEFLTILAGQAAIAIHNSQLHEQTKRQAIELERANRDLERQEEIQGLLKELSIALSKLLDARAVAREILAAVQRLIPGTVARLWEKAPKEDVLCLVASIGMREPEGGITLQLQLGRGFTGIAAATKELIISADVTKDSRYVNRDWALAEGLVSTVHLPFLYGAEVYGVLAIFTREPHLFTDSELGLLRSFASQAAIAIHNARLYEQTKNQAVELEKASKVKDEFLGFVSHELKTPVNSILGYTEMMQSKMFGEINSEQERALGKVMANSRDLLNMVNGL
ncbi:MAG: GAF domain-containing protein, partial [Deltaproteobacteria bacterium]